MVDGLADRRQRGLLPFSRKREVLILLGDAMLDNFFWRWLTLPRRLFDAQRGERSWEKLARQGLAQQDEDLVVEPSRAA